MVPAAFVRQYAVGQQIAVEVADQEIVLHYVLALLHSAGLVGGATPEGASGPLLFKGGTALRKCVFGSTGRFSQDIDFDATHENGFEADIEEALRANNPFHGITFSIPNFRYSQDGNFSGSVSYQHDHGQGRFELQISYRLDPILDPRDLTLQPQSYFDRVEFPPPAIRSLDPYEMIGEKVMACNRRLGGSAKDVYDLYLWSNRPFDEPLVRRLAVLKAWTDQRHSPRYRPAEFLHRIEPASFRWHDLGGLIPRRLESNAQAICERVRDRFDFLVDCTEHEEVLLADQGSHREHGLFSDLRAEARDMAARIVG